MRIVRAVAGLFLLSLMLAGGSPETSQPDAPPSPAATRDGRWIQDIDYLARELPRLHPDGLAGASSHDFDRARLSLDARVPHLTDGEIEVGLRALVALMRDPHTTVAIPVLHRYPLELTWFPSGLYATSVPASHPELLGARLVSIDDVPAARAFQRASSTIPHENDPWLWAITPGSLVQAEVLTYTGIAPPAPADYEATFKFTNGNSVSVLTLTTDRVPVASIGANTLYRKHRQTDFWYGWLPGDVLYIAYNQCVRSYSLDEFERLLPSFLKRAQRVIIDLRNNEGGDSLVFQPILTALRGSHVDRPGKLYGLVGRETFSSGLMAAEDLRSETHAITLGEATGGTPSAYGEVRTFALPNSHLEVGCSTRYFRNMNFRGQSLFPDRIIQPTIADLIAGNDPVLQAAVP